MGALTNRKTIFSRLAARIAPFVEARLADRMLSALDAHFADRLVKDLEARVNTLVDGMLAGKQEDFYRLAEGRVAQLLGEKAAANPLLGSQLYLPNGVVAGSAAGPYMAASNALARDFLHPEFAEFCKLYYVSFAMHRKLWEWAFIYHHLRNAGVLQPGHRGLGFGVGREALPALFAGFDVAVTATDAPRDEGGWRRGDQQSARREELFQGQIVDRDRFDRNVAFALVDMNDIPPELNGFDFCWSSCSMEHLGTLQHGIDFVVTSIERTLKIGGVACHTTELNLSSDEETVEAGHTVLYRKQDLERLCRLLEERGHRVLPLRIEPGSLVADFLVDVPPYRKDPHLKLQLGQFVTTSVGIVAWRGR